MSDTVSILAIAGPWLAQFADVDVIELVVTLPDGRRCTLCAGLRAPGAHTAHNPEAGAGASADPPPAPAPAASAPAASALPFNLRPKHRAILAAASAEPMSRKAIILRAHVAYTPDARRCLAQLVRAGLLEAVPNGIRLPRP